MAWIYLMLIFTTLTEHEVPTMTLVIVSTLIKAIIHLDPPPITTLGVDKITQN